MSRLPDALERGSPAAKRVVSAAQWKPQPPRSDFARWPIFCC